MDLIQKLGGVRKKFLVWTAIALLAPPVIYKTAEFNSKFLPILKNSVPYDAIMVELESEPSTYEANSNLEDEEKHTFFTDYDKVSKETVDLLQSNTPEGKNYMVSKIEDRLRSVDSCFELSPEIKDTISSRIKRFKASSLNNYDINDLLSDLITSKPVEWCVQNGSYGDHLKGDVTMNIFKQRLRTLFGKPYYSPILSHELTHVVSSRNSTYNFNFQYNNSYTNMEELMTCFLNNDEGYGNVKSFFPVLYSELNEQERNFLIENYFLKLERNELNNSLYNSIKEKLKK